MINLFALEEMNGLTPALVKEWALSVGYVQCGVFSGCERFTRSKQDRSEDLGLSDSQIFVADAQSLQSSLLVIANREGMTLQQVLRAINPRWRRRTPDAADVAWQLAQHGGNWLRRTSAGGPGARIYSTPVIVRLVEAPSAAEVETDERVNAEHWPIDRDAYRVPWRPQPPADPAG